MCLLGCGEVGKSTIFKQLQYISLGYPDQQAIEDMKWKGLLLFIIIDNAVRINQVEFNNYCANLT